MEKECTVCHQVKPLDAFTKSKRSKHGRANLCKLCRARLRSPGRYEANVKRQQGLKFCRGCQQWKNLDEFHLSNKNVGRQSFCKPCANLLSKTWRIKHPKYHDVRKHRDPTYRRRQKLLHLYGITIQQYDDHYASQKVVCSICGGKEVRILHGEEAPLVVDHNHATGIIRGLLCHACNTGLGILEKTGFASAAMDYLRRNP